MTWVPPHGGAPVGPREPVPAPPVASTPTEVPPAPPPAEPSTTAPAAASPAPSGDASLGRVIGVAVVGAVVAGCLIGGIGTGLSQANPPSYAPPPGSGGGQPTTGDYSDLATGSPGSPDAVLPTECDTACFGEAEITQVTLPDTAFEDSGFDIHGLATTDRLTALQVHLDAVEAWAATGYTPDECFVTSSEFPVVEPADEDAATGIVAPLAAQSISGNSTSTIRQSVRLFPDSKSAQDYMAMLSDGIRGCTRYTNASGYPIDVVTPEPGIHPPDNVAAVGWAQSPQAGQRIYAFDMQRGNLVIRSYAVSGGGLDDAQFRRLMMRQASALGDLPEPTPAG